MQTYKTLVAHALESVGQVMPWDLADELISNKPPLLIDVREEKDFNLMHIKNSIHIPRGVLEPSCEWGYDDTVPALARARDQNIVIICRSGRRSALAGLSMQQMGFSKVRSLAMGIKGWNDSYLELINYKGEVVNGDKIDAIFNKSIAKEKLG